LEHLQKEVSGCALERSAPSLPWPASHHGIDGAMPFTHVGEAEARAFNERGLFRLKAGLRAHFAQRHDRGRLAVRSSNAQKTSTQ
jgi:hypothetical protein